MQPALASPPARFFLGRFAFWFLLSLLVSLAVAFLSVLVQMTGFAPVIFMSVVVGGVLGAAFNWLVTQVAFAQRPTVLVCVVFLGLVTAGAQHVFFYLHTRNVRQQQLADDPKAAFAEALNPEFGDLTFAQYMTARTDRKTVALWVVDASLIVLVAVAYIVVLGEHPPYCNDCRSWYQLVRHQNLSPRQLAAIAQAIDVSLSDDIDDQTGHCRLESCPTGCGPTRLCLTCMKDKRTGIHGVLHEVWLNSDDRREIEALL